MEISYLYGIAYMKNKNLTNHQLFLKLKGHTLKRCKGSSIFLTQQTKKLYVHITFLYLYINIFIYLYLYIQRDSHLIKFKNI